MLFRWLVALRIEAVGLRRDSAVREADATWVDFDLLEVRSPWQLQHKPKVRWHLFCPEPSRRLLAASFGFSFGAVGSSLHLWPLFATRTLDILFALALCCHSSSLRLATRIR